MDEPPIYDNRMKDAPEWARLTVSRHWPSRSSFRIVGVKERGPDYAVAVKSKDGRYGVARILSDTMLRHRPKRLVEMMAGEAERILENARQPQ